MVHPLACRFQTQAFHGAGRAHRRPFGQRLDRQPFAQMLAHPAQQFGKALWPLLSFGLEALPLAPGPADAGPLGPKAPPPADEEATLAPGRKSRLPTAEARFCATVDLVNALEQEKAANKAGQLAERLLKLDLIILDELGYLQFSPSGGALLFHLLSKLYERISVVT